MTYSLEACLPKAYVEAVEGQYNLHWDVDMSYEACLIVDEHRDYIEGFLDGCYKLLSSNHQLPTRVWGHSSGYVQNIPKEVAETLAQLIKELFHGLVKARFDNIKERQPYERSD